MSEFQLTRTGWRCPSCGRPMFQWMVSGTQVLECANLHDTLHDGYRVHRGRLVRVKVLFVEHSGLLVAEDAA